MTVSENGTVESAIWLASSDASACGLLLSKGRDWNTTIRVTAAGMRTGYLLDRWE